MTEPEDAGRDEAAEAAEEALDLDDLDREGIDGVLAGMRGEGEDAPIEVPKRRRGRSPLVSLFVVAFGVYLMASLWADFSFWLSPRVAHDLGDAASWVEDGRAPAGFDNEYVAISGTPDVQHAARLSTKTRYIGYRRITEAGGTLFAALPRDKAETITNNFAGRFEGRMRHMSTHSAYGWIKEFFDRENILRILDASPDALAASVAAGGEKIETTEGPVTLGPEDRIRLVISQPEATVQLGKSSFRTEAAAEEAIRALGYPYVKSPRDTQTFHTYLVRIPEGQLDAAQARLNEGLEVPADNADPKLGALVLPRTATYVAPPDELGIADGAIRFPYGDNTTSPGYELKDGKLAPRSVAEGVLVLPMASLTAVRVEQPIRVEPDGYVIMVGETPADAMRNGVLWIVVFGITLANLASILLWWRRRRSAGAAA